MATPRPRKSTVSGQHERKPEHRNNNPKMINQTTREESARRTLPALSPAIAIVSLSKFVGISLFLFLTSHARDTDRSLFFTAEVSGLVLLDVQFYDWPRRFYENYKILKKRSKCNLKKVMQLDRSKTDLFSVTGLRTPLAHSPAIKKKEIHYFSLSYTDAWTVKA